MTIENVRRMNALTLVEEAGGQARFAEKTGMSRQYASFIVGRGTKPKWRKVIGSDMARHIEQSFGRPVGRLDEDHSRVERSRLALQDTVAIGGLDAGGILGPGRLPMLLDATVRQMQVSKDWIRANLRGSASDYLALATIADDSMADELPHGSLVLVDRSASSVLSDGVYLLAREDDDAAPFARRIHRTLDGGYRISARRRSVKPEELPDLSSSGLVVLGRVVATLELRRV